MPAGYGTQFPIDPYGYLVVLYMQIYSRCFTMLKFDWILIRIERERSGLTQQAAADAAGINIRQFQRYESGQSEPLISQYLKIVQALDIDPADLLRDE